MIERLPTPWGLVRSGVAPDHQKIKTVSKVFEKISIENNFRLFANVELGKDVSLKDLKDLYDAVVIATGSSAGRKLGIIGEEFKNCISAADFVPWYNAHPDFSKLSVDLSVETAVVIGVGNVALDVARLLAKDTAELEQTDISLNALTHFKSSKIKNVFICGRRGPENANFTPPELRDLLKLKNTAVLVDSSQIDQAISRIERMGEIERDIKSNLDIMRLVANQSFKNVNRKLELKFFLSPKEIKGKSRVEEIIFSINQIADGQVITTGKNYSIKAGLVITAIGYDSVEIPGVKFQNGHIANIAGHVGQNVYVTGWAKRGSVGVIGTNKSDSSNVVDLIIGNLKEPKNLHGIEILLKSGHKLVDKVGWEKINSFELISGELVGKPRLKEDDWSKLINLSRSK
jgi:ferredoxin--NADP+ reductase